MAKKQKIVRSEVNPLRFVGEQERPARPEEVVARRPQLGKGEQPEALQAMNNQRSFYIHTAKDKKKPRVNVQKVDKGSESAIWRVDIPQDQLYGNALPLQTAVREKPQKILKNINPDVSFSSYRPDWTDMLYSPRPAPDVRQAMQRMNGRPIDPLYVFGADNRVAYRDSSWPWGLVGKIFAGAGNQTLWTGSGALIWNNIVVTAGHVVPWGQPGWWMRFVPAYYDGVSLYGTGVQSYVSDAYGYNTNGSVTGYDWAILKLYTSLGSSLGYFGYNGYSDSWEDDSYWTVLGYPGAVAGGLRPSYQTSVSVFDDDSDSNGGRELETKADMTPGNSGGPMFGWWGNDPRIIGVVSGEETDYIFPFFWEQGNVVAGGSGFTNLVSWGRTNW